MSFEYQGPEGTSQVNGDGLVITKEDQRLVKDTLAQIRAGTGPWSSIFAAINAVGGGLFGAAETFSKLFSGTEEGRQFTRMVYVMGRSALAASPRFAVGDLNTTGTLFPNPDDFMANPVSEANKFKNLAATLKDEQVRMQEALSAGTVAGALRDTYFVKLNEIDRLQKLMGPVQAMGNPASVTDISGAQNNFDSKIKNPTRTNVKPLNPLVETSLRPKIRNLSQGN